MNPYKKENPPTFGGEETKCFHNGIILIVNCFQNCDTKIYKNNLLTTVVSRNY